MADRALVRQGPVVRRSRRRGEKLAVVSLSLALTVLALGQAPKSSDAPAKKAAPATEPAPSKSAASKIQPVSGDEQRAIPLELRPYSIRVWLVLDPRARIDGPGREVLIAEWLQLAQRFVGSPWNIQIAAGDGPLLGDDLAALRAEAVKPLAKDVDKAWIFRIAPSGTELEITGREYDTATERIGLASKRQALIAADAARAMFLLALDIFCPSAQIGASSAGGVAINVQGSMLTPAHPMGKVVGPGSAFRVARVFYKPDGSLIRIDLVKNTYLRVESLTGPSARCQIISSLRDPLTKMVVGRNKLLALGVKPSSVPSRFRFLTPPPDKRPAAGYTVTSALAPNGAPRVVGATDREGRVVLNPGFADNVVKIRLLAADVEPLVEFPVMPGESVEERTILIDPLARTVTLETELNSLRDEIVDLVAVRSRLEAKLKARADGEAWPDVRLLLDDYAKLPPRQKLADRLDRLKGEATAEQATTKKKILTRTAQLLLTDTNALIERYLDDGGFQAYENAWKEYQELQVKEKADAEKKARAKAGIRYVAPPPAGAANPANAAANPAPAAPQQKGQPPLGRAPF